MDFISRRAEYSPSLERLFVVFSAAGIAVKSKNSSILMRLIGVLRPGFKYRFTAIGSTIWAPADHIIEKTPFGALFRQLAHEYVHIMDSRKHPIVYPLTYWTPQIFVLTTPLALLGLKFWPFYIFVLGFIGCMRLPSPRIHWEMRAYAMNLVLKRIQNLETPEEEFDAVVDSLMSSYYYMDWSRDRVKSWLYVYYEYALYTDKDLTYRRIKVII